MLILPAEADEKVVSTAIDRITKVVSTNGGEVADIDRWGRRRFAFEIDHQHEGYYVVATFTAEPTAQAELDRVLNLADEVIRHKVLALPAKRNTLASAAEQRSARVSAATSAPTSAPTNEAEASPASA
jgi:small subunit ribosomal protein S6